MTDDIVTRLQVEIDVDGDDAWTLLIDAKSEIERLRAAGDAMAEALRSGSDSGWDAAIDAWQEARRA